MTDQDAVPQTNNVLNQRITIPLGKERSISLPLPIFIAGFACLTACACMAACLATIVARRATQPQPALVLAITDVTLGTRVPTQAPPIPTATSEPSPIPTATQPPIPVGGPCPSPYIVQPGDTVMGIANLCGTNVQDIVSANNLQNPQSLRIGQAIVIPGGQVVTPQVTQAPTNTPATQSTPIQANTPVQTNTPVQRTTPVQQATPTSTNEPKPTATNTVASQPTPTLTGEPTKPTPTNTAESQTTPTPSETPDPQQTSQPTSTASATSSTQTPTSTHTPTPTSTSESAGNCSIDSWTWVDMSTSEQSREVTVYAELMCDGEPAVGALMSTEWLFEDDTIEECNEGTTDHDGVAWCTLTIDASVLSEDVQIDVSIPWQGSTYSTQVYFTPN